MKHDRSCDIHHISMSHSLPCIICIMTPGWLTVRIHFTTRCTTGCTQQVVKCKHRSRTSTRWYQYDCLMLGGSETVAHSNIRSVLIVVCHQPTHHRTTTILQLPVRLLEIRTKPLDVETYSAYSLTLSLRYGPKTMFWRYHFHVHNNLRTAGVHLHTSLQDRNNVFML